MIYFQKPWLDRQLKSVQISGSSSKQTLEPPNAPLQPIQKHNAPEAQGKEQ